LRRTRQQPSSKLPTAEQAFACWFCDRINSNHSFPLQGSPSNRG
jgi:hypothetical protein